MIIKSLEWSNPYSKKDQWLEKYDNWNFMKRMNCPVFSS